MEVIDNTSSAGEEKVQVQVEHLHLADNSNKNKDDAALSPEKNLEEGTLLIKAEKNTIKTEKAVDGDVKVGGDSDDAKQKKRKLGGEAVFRLFETPIAMWTLGQWALLFVLIWLASYFLNRCCPCFYDLLACFCCYELFCDPDPAGFILC